MLGHPTPPGSVSSASPRQELFRGASVVTPGTEETEAPEGTARKRGLGSGPGLVLAPLRCPVQTRNKQA